MLARKHFCLGMRYVCAAAVGPILSPLVLPIPMGACWTTFGLSVVNGCFGFGNCSSLQPSIVAIVQDVFGRMARVCVCVCVRATFVVVFFGWRGWFAFVKLCAQYLFPIKHHGVSNGLMFLFLDYP